MLASARHLATGACLAGLPAVPGRRVGRAFTPAATGHPGRISATQGGNAPLRLRLAPHPPPVCGARIVRRALKHACTLRPRRCREAAKTGAMSEGRSYVFYRRTGDKKRCGGRLLHEKLLHPPQAALDSAAPYRGGFQGAATSKGSPMEGSCRRRKAVTEGWLTHPQPCR